MQWDQGQWDVGYWDQEPSPSAPFPVQGTIEHNIRTYRMNDRQRNEVHRLLRVQGFCTEHAPKFATQLPKPGDAMFQTQRADLATLIGQINDQHSTQASGSFGQASADQAQERLELEALLRAVNRTARAIAITTGNPGLMDRFRMPASNNDVLLATVGDAFADAIVELNLAAPFTQYGYEGDVVAQLRAEAQDVRDAEGGQGAALSTQAGATAGLPALLRAGRGHVRTLDSIMRNRFRNDPVMLGAWRTASHVTAAPSGDGGEPPPPPPPPTPPA